MRVPFVRRLTARFSRGFVLAFHDIEQDEMERLVEAVWPVQPVPLSELVERCKAGKNTSGLCAITVDDGVGNTVEQVVALCRRRSWPATFYLPTGNLDTRAGLSFEWWRRIRPLLPGRRFELPSGVLDFSRQESVDQMADVLERLWHDAPLEAYHRVTMQLVEAVSRDSGISLESLRPSPPIAWDRVAQLSREPLFDFGSHGVSHAAMKALPEDELAAEMRRSRDTISEHTRKPCRHLAYPFGSLRSIGNVAPLIARCYYDSAATMKLGHVDAADPWLLPRLPLYPENSSWLARLKVLAKCSRLAGPRARREAAEEIRLGAQGRPGGSHDYIDHYSVPK